MGTAFALGYNCVAAWLGYGGDVYLVGSVIGYACDIIFTVLRDYAVALEGILNFILGILDFEDLASEVGGAIGEVTDGGPIAIALDGVDAR